MSYRIPLPAGGHRARLDLVEPNSTAVQRAIRRSGLAEYEPPTAATLLTLFDQAGPGHVFFDVGANMGLYAFLDAAMFRPSAVHAFEPTPDTADVLRRIERRNRLGVTLFEAAAGDAEGSAPLHLSGVSDASNSLVAGFKATTRGVVEVPTITIDAHVARAGAMPNVMKIDVETFEPAVLAGARGTIAACRPHIVVEVLYRRDHDHGEEITAALDGLGYHFYDITADPTWEPAPRMRGTPGSPDRDWLAAPRPLPGDFADRWATWSDRLAACTVDRNPRVPLTLAAQAAWRRGGPREVLASARRYAGARNR